MFDVYIEANASELLSNKLLNVNNLIRCWPFSLNTLPHLFEKNLHALRVALAYPTSSKSAGSDTIKLARSHRLARVTGYSTR